MRARPLPVHRAAPLTPRGRPSRASSLLLRLAALGAGAFGRALDEGGFLDELGSGATILAPSDEAFAELAECLGDDRAAMLRSLRLHVSPRPGLTVADLERRGRLDSMLGQRLYADLDDEGSVRVDGAQLLQTDLRVASHPGVVIHILDRALAPAELDLLELLHLSDNFGRLLHACEVLDMEALLRGSLPYTLLAPRGLMTLPTWEWHELLRPAVRPTLRTYLHRHIVPGRSYLDEGARLRSLGGQRMDVEGAGARLHVGGRRVLVRDVEARNGLIHVIDGSFGIG